MSLGRFISDYQAKTARSRLLHEEALRVMPGGNSRTTIFFDPYPSTSPGGAVPGSGTWMGSSGWTLTATTRA